MNYAAVAVSPSDAPLAGHFPKTQPIRKLLTTPIQIAMKLQPIWSLKNTNFNIHDMKANQGTL